MRGYAAELAWSLVKDHDVKALVVACNTAAAAGLDDLRAELPGARARRHRARRRGARRRRRRRAGSASSARSAPIASGAYVRAVDDARRPPGVEVDLTSAACPGFVEFVERGLTSGDEITVLAERLLAPVAAADVDALLLGCTHYPFLARVIGDVMGPA